MNSYPVDLTLDDNDTVMVTFPDVPEVVTFGDDETDALARAVDALETALNGYITDRRDIPAPSDAAGRPTVAPSLLGSLKLGVYGAMRARGWRKADLARAMGLNPRQIDRLLDLTHASTVAQLEQAAAVAGGRYTVEVLFGGRASDTSAGAHNFRHRAAAAAMATNEEAVVGKTARVVEEVVVSKTHDERLDPIEGHYRRSVEDRLQTR